MSRTPLGKGLDSLLGTTPIDGSSGQVEGLKKVPISQINPNPDQPRQTYDEDTLRALGNSIQAQGVMQPLIARRLEDGTFQLISGERRLRAAQLVGLSDVPVIEREATPEESILLALVENLQREDLNAYDAARAMQQLSENYNLTQEEIAQELGKSRSAVANTLRLLQLNENVQKLVQNGEIEEGTARALLALPERAQLTVAKKVIAGRLSVRETEALVRRHGKSRVKRRPNPDVQNLEQELSESLGASVQITQRSKRGGGFLRISYRNLEQLQAIIKRMKN